MAAAALHLDTRVLKSNDGTEIYAEACGDHSKPHVVFVHGIACTSAAFDTIFSVPEFQKNLYLVRYDWRGHGRSGKPTTEESYSSKSFSDDFDAVYKAFDLDKPFYVGWSYGGTIAADICANHNPTSISGIVWLAALPYVGELMPFLLTPLLGSLLPPLVDPETTPAKALEGRINFCRAMVPPGLLPKVPPTVMATWIAATVYLSPDCAKYLSGRKQDPSRLKEEAANGLPLCIINGAEDPMIFGDVLIEKMKPQFKDFEAHTLPGGHILIWEDPKTVADIILKFVARVTSNKA